jgi:membrane-bound lytic murein transglycosylase B
MLLTSACATVPESEAFNAPADRISRFELKERCAQVAYTPDRASGPRFVSYEIASAAWTPPPPVPLAPPHRPDILSTPEPVLGTTGDPKVDAYRDRILNSYDSQHGWRPYLRRLFAGLCADGTILTAAETEPRSFAAAVDRYLTPGRIAEGRRLYRELSGRPPFTGEAKVPLDVLLAMWAVTSDYGRDLPRYDMIQAQLVRGAYDQLSYPEAFEIYEAAAIILSGKVERATSLAYADGRIGQLRLLPSNYEQWARDGDGDGRSDIWHNRADILKTFNDMMSGTWEPGMPILVEIEPLRLNMNDPAQARLARGIGSGQGIKAEYFKRVDGQPWPSETWGGKPITPFGPSGPTFLLTSNETPVNVMSPFRAKWGDWKGQELAVAVGLLADAIAGRPGPTRPIR